MLLKAKLGVNSVILHTLFKLTGSSTGPVDQVHFSIFCRCWELQPTPPAYCSSTLFSCTPAPPEHTACQLLGGFHPPLSLFYISSSFKRPLTYPSFTKMAASAMVARCPARVFSKATSSCRSSPTALQRLRYAASYGSMICAHDLANIAPVLNHSQPSQCSVATMPRNVCVL